MGNFGSRFRECRKAAGLKQDAAARLVGVSQSAISQFERDAIEPTIDVAVRMAQAYGCSIDHLLGLDTPDNGIIVRTIMRDGE